MSSNPVLTTLADGILTVTINRPEAKNAIDKAVAEGIAAALAQLDADPAISLAVLTGAGGSFCTGMDLKALMRGERPFIEGRGFAGLCSAPPQKPLIAAIEGHAVAGGLEIALACDLVVAAEDAKLGLPEVKVGLIAGAGGLLRAPRLMPPRIAMELALTGQFISAQRAYELGLVNRVVAKGAALDAALALAKTIAANGPLAVQTSKRLMLEAQDWPASEMFARQEPLLEPIWHSEDAKEGARAFAEKRTPNWQGR